MGELEACLQAYIPSSGVPHAYARLALEQYPVADADDFRELIDFTLVETGLPAEDIAEAAGVDPVTVLSWKDGFLPPRPTRLRVRDYIIERVS